MVGLMMAYPVVSSAAFGWMVVCSVLAAFAVLLSRAKTRMQRAVIVVAAVVITAILITNTAKADDFPCPTCGCVWPFC